MTLRHGIALFLLANLWAQGACNPSRFVLRRSAPTLDRAMGVFAAYEDPVFARQAAPPLLALVEGLLASDPDNPALLRILARGLYEYTFGFLHREAESLAVKEPDQAEKMRRRARHHYIRVYELGLRLLRTQGVSITLQRTDPQQIRHAVARLDKRAVPALTWTAVGAGGALQLGIDQAWLMQMRSGIGVLLERAIALDPGYADALPAAALGMYYGVDADLGGSALLSQRYFELAIAQTERRFLLWLVLYAKHWAWQFQSTTEERVGSGPDAKMTPVLPMDKRALFISLLDEVQSFPLEKAPSNRLANVLAKEAAEMLRSKANDFLDAHLAPPRRPGPLCPLSRLAPPRRPGPLCPLSRLAPPRQPGPLCPLSRLAPPRRLGPLCPLSRQAPHQRRGGRS